MRCPTKIKCQNKLKPKGKKGKNYNLIDLKHNFDTIKLIVISSRVEVIYISIDRKSMKLTFKPSLPIRCGVMDKALALDMQVVKSNPTEVKNFLFVIFTCFAFLAA